VVLKTVFMANGSDRDIKFLKIKLKLYLYEEKYEKAATMKDWIIELGGDPEVEGIEELLNNKEKKIQ
jgi:protein-arginine kinase activator protein McsA